MTTRRSPVPPRATRAIGYGLVVGLLAVVLTSCGALSDRFGDDDATPTSVVKAVVDPTALPSMAPLATSGGTDDAAGTLTGRLIDAVTGLPVADAGVSLLGRERRAISAPDGRFRFDGLNAGATTVVIGPVRDYVARSLDVRIGDDGLDLGITPMLPTSPPTLILPEYGGVVVGCEGTQAQFATNSVPGPSAVSATCLTDPRAYPAPAPSGRLPLAVVDLAPGDLGVDPAVTLAIALPKQPRFGDGVALDLLRLDLERLIWVPTGSLSVEPGGAQATGSLDQLGSYMVAAPPLGAGLGAGGSGPTVHQFHLSAEPGGPPADVFPTGTVVVYATYDYTNADDTPITTRAFGSGGEVVFEERRAYVGRGDDSVPMLADGNAWPPGDYNTTIYVGEPATLAYSIAWRVASAPTDIPPTPTLPSVPGSSATTGGATQVPVPPSSGCSTPAGWYAYVVQPGDTLLSLAQRTGTTVAALQEGNCLNGTNIYAGTVIYVPRPPYRPATAQPTRPAYASPVSTRPTYPTRFPTAVPSGTAPPTAASPPTGVPTTSWWTPPPQPTSPVQTQPVPTQPQPSSAPPSAVPTSVPPTALPTAPTVPTSAPPSVAPPTLPAPTVPPPTVVGPTAPAPTSPAPQPTTGAPPTG